MMPAVLSKRVFLIATLFASLFGGGISHAAWYKVEVILFKHNDSDSINSEHHSSELVKLDTDRAVALKGKGAFRRLKSGERSLNAVASRMRNSRHYKVLAHTAWVQPAYRTRNKKVAMLAYNVDGGSAINVGEIPLSDQKTIGTAGSDNFDIVANSQPRVNALISLYSGRYLHLDTEMVYYADTDGTAAYSDPNAAYNPDAEVAVVTSNAQLTAYHLKEKRRIRSLGALHYYDHPAIGIVAKITRVK